MAWMKVETSVSRNRKFVTAGPGPSWLWLCGLAYCQEGLTDGFIPTQAIDYLGVKHAIRLAVRLVSAGLWDAVDGGWQVHDYLDHNKPASEIRRIQKVRGDGGKLGGRPSATENLQGKPSQKPSGAEKGNHTENPSVRTATATAPATSTARENAARPPTLVQPRNPEAIWDGPRGLYVLPKQHQRFVASRNGNVAEVFAFYGQVGEVWGYGAHKDSNIEQDMFKFWTARYAEQWPAAARASVPATMRAVEPSHWASCVHTPKCGSLRQCIEKNRETREAPA